MHFVLQTSSLQHIAEVKIVAHLWSQRDIFTQISRLPGHQIRQEANEWKEIEEKVESKVWALPLPPLCKKHLLNLIKPLGMEIIRWCCYHCEDKINFQYLDTLLPQQVCWTMHGTVDYGKTTELILKNVRLDIKRRYELACINCLEDQARQLFQRMSKDQKLEYVRQGRSRREQHYVAEDHYHQLILSFTCTFNDDVAHLHMYSRCDASFHECLFQDALLYGTRATCEYLFKKLNQRAKDEVVKEWSIPFFTFMQATSGGCVSVDSVLFFLYVLNEEQQEWVFITGRKVYRLLQCLLRWPMQSLFVKVAERAWQFMDSAYQAQVLRAILFKISSGFRDYDYYQLFWECWRLSSVEHKQEFLDNDDYLVRLFKTKQEEFILLVFNEAPWFRLKQYADNKFKKIKHVLLDESAICDRALTECKQTAVLNSSNDKENVEKRLRSQHLTRLVDIVMEERMKRRRL